MKKFLLALVLIWHFEKFDTTQVASKHNFLYGNYQQEEQDALSQRANEIYKNYHPKYLSISYYGRWGEPIIIWAEETR